VKTEGKGGLLDCRLNREGRVAAVIDVKKERKGKG